MSHIMVTAGALDVAVELHGPEGGPPVVLLHGFPDDVRAWDGVARGLAARGMRVVVPYLRGYGPTRYRDPATPRSGQQAALGADLLALMDALGIRRALLAGYDWGGRAACIVAALWPERVRGLVSANGYNIQDIAGSARPAPPEQEARYWYQWYLHTDRGVAALEQDRRAFCRLLWRMWSPSWRFTEAEFEATAAAWDNPDFVATVVQSYRHRRRAIRRSRDSRTGSRPARRSPCRPWCCTARRMGWTRRTTARAASGGSPGPSGGRWCPERAIFSRARRHNHELHAWEPRP